MSKFKFNWGWGILFSIIVFLLIMAALIIFSMNKEVNLVTKDYYKDELDYQNQIDKTNATLNLNKEINISQEGKRLVITFPDSTDINGEIIFYRPSNYKLDFKMPINLTSGKSQIIDKKYFAKGFWKVKINWNHIGHDFYTEKSFLIQ